MSQDFRGPALVVTVGFLVIAGLAYGLMRLLKAALGAFDAREARRGSGPLTSLREGSARFARTHWSGRLAGIGIVLLGLGLAALAWHDAHHNRFFSFKAAAGGPMLVGIGVWMVLDGPSLSETRNPSAPGWALMALGLLVGLVYTTYLQTGRIGLF